MKTTAAKYAWRHLLDLAKIAENQNLATFHVYASDWKGEHIVELDRRNEFDVESFAHAAADLLDQWTAEIGIGIYPVDHKISVDARRIQVVIRPVNG